MTRPSTAFTDIDFERNGRQVGFVAIPHSPHSDAWGQIRIPIAVIRNGTGPTVVLQGGNHGDEYEGPITLGEIIRDLDPSTVSGRLIILPAVNAPAVAQGHRTSPVDGLNFNRSFPGDPLGTITQQISAYVHDVIFPMGDAFVDLHSGGSSLEILPSAIIEPSSDPALHRRNIAAVLAFDAPLTVVIANLGDPRTATAAAVRAGLVTVGTEMAGAGTVSLDALRICRQGVRNLLAHLGVLPAVDVPVAPTKQRQILNIPGPKGYVFSSKVGVFEPAQRLGAVVRAGELAGHVHNLLEPGEPPHALHFAADGVVFGRRHPGRVVSGNCCAVVAAPYEGTLD